MSTTTITTGAPSADNCDEVTLLAQWKARVERARLGDSTALPEGVTLGTLRVFGRSGDQPVAFPVIRAIADLEELPADVQFGLTVANRTITAFGARGGNRMTFASAPGEEPEQITVLGPHQAHRCVAGRRDRRRVANWQRKQTTRCRSILYLVAS